MRFGEDVLKSCVGQILRNGKFQRFIFNGIQVNNIHLTFLQFENWIQIDTNDWVSVQKMQEIEIKELPPIADNNDNTAEFPRQNIESEFSPFGQLLGKKLLDYSEIIPTPIGNPCGLLLKFSENKYLTIFSDIKEETYYKFDNIIPDGFGIQNDLIHPLVKELYDNIPELMDLMDREDDSMAYSIYGELTFILYKDILENAEATNFAKKCFNFFNKLADKDDSSIDELLWCEVYEGLYASKKCNKTANALLHGRNKELYEYWKINGGISADSLE